jgi:hypothetical protein
VNGCRLAPTPLAAPTFDEGSGNAANAFVVIVISRHFAVAAVGFPISICIVSAANTRARIHSYIVIQMI